MKEFKILFIYPNDPAASIAPSNLALLSAYLKHAGFYTKLFDCSNYMQGKKEFQDDIRANLGHATKTNVRDYYKISEVNMEEDFIKVVNEYEPNLIAVTVVESTIPLALSLIKLIKNKHIPNIFGGVGVTFSYKKLLNSDVIDYTCIGEGEEVLVEVAQRLSNNQGCEDIKNIYYKNKNGEIVKNPLRKLLDINSMPTPDFSIYEDQRFYRPFREGVTRQLAVDLDRGCLYKCTYCCSPSLTTFYKESGCGKFYRIKTNDKFFKDTKILIKKHNINMLYFTTETILSTPLEKFREFAKRYKEEINLPFHCQTRLDTFTEEKTRLLIEMGCKSICVGLEHGSEKIRKEILNKHISNDQIIKAFNIISKYNIIITVNNMVGFPGETRENVFETINMCRRIKEILQGRIAINVFIFIPFSGTRLKEVCIEKGFIDKDIELPFIMQDKSVLHMPPPFLSNEETVGLCKTFGLYVKLPESYWPEIKMAEKNNEEGNAMFNKLIKLI